MSAPPVINPDRRSDRLGCLDACRGLVMFTLLCGPIFHSLRGHPVWNWLAVQNNHVAWEGCTYWDLIQPSFMFLVGVAMPFAFGARSARGDSRLTQFRHALLRALNLTILGLLLDNFGSARIEIGFIRVLQQIAISYLLAFWFVGTSYWRQGISAVLILVGYTAIWMFNPWNGPGGAVGRG